MAFNPNAFQNNAFLVMLAAVGSALLNILRRRRRR